MTMKVTDNQYGRLS